MAGVGGSIGDCFEGIVGGELAKNSRREFWGLFVIITFFNKK